MANLLFRIPMVIPFSRSTAMRLINLHRIILKNTDTDFPVIHNVSLPEKFPAHELIINGQFYFLKLFQQDNRIGAGCFGGGNPHQINTG